MNISFKNHLNLGPYTRLIQQEGYGFSARKFADIFRHSEEESRLIEEQQPPLARSAVDKLPSLRPTRQSDVLRRARGHHDRIDKQFVADQHQA